MARLTNTRHGREKKGRDETIPRKTAKMVHMEVAEIIILDVAKIILKVAEMIRREKDTGNDYNNIERKKKSDEYSKKKLKQYSKC